MKRSIWAALCIITVFGVIVGWNWRITPQPQAIETSFEQQAQAVPPAQSDSPFPALEVNVDRLWADVTALAFKRFTPADRSLARGHILDALREAGWSPRAQPFEQGVNIVAERPGTDPTAGKILLGAHYDTVEQAPGADDNATAVATVLEAARLLGATPTPRGLQLVLFDEEEVGLLGSFAFTDRPAETRDLRGAVVLEMLGFACYTPGCQRYPLGLPIAPPSDQGNFLAVIGDQDHLPLIHSFEQGSQANLPPVVTLPIPMVPFLPPDLLRSDHAAFWRKGLGAVMVTDTANFRSPHYHLPSDTVETIDKPFFFGSAQLVVNAVTLLLNGGDVATETSAPVEGVPTAPI